jgi:hypothetical protein
MRYIPSKRRLLQESHGKNTVFFIVIDAKTSNLVKLIIFAQHWSNFFLYEEVILKPRSYKQSVGLLDWRLAHLSACTCTGQIKFRINVDRYHCLECEPNPGSQCLSGERHMLPYTYLCVEIYRNEMSGSSRIFIPFLGILNAIKIYMTLKTFCRSQKS